MSAYVVGDINITDPAGNRAHVPVALAAIARFGGRVIAGGKLELLDGGPPPERIIIIELPASATARRWYRSDEYQPAAKDRLVTSHGRVFPIDGVEPSLRPGWLRPQARSIGEVFPSPPGCSTIDGNKRAGAERDA